MALTEPAELLMMDEVRALASTLDSATHGAAGELIAQFRRHVGWSKAKVYQRLAGVGWSSGRKTRSDKGRTRQDAGVLADISFTIKNGVRENGKPTMFTPNAVSMLSQNGREISVSNSRINTLLRQRQMHLAAQRQDTPYQSMQSLHPNHVHQADPSLCLIYYLPDGTQHIMRDSEFYKNKLENIAKIKLKVWRYVLTDHYSASIVVRYYQARGETQANLYDFLLYAWAFKEGKIIHGVPLILLWDKGSANTAGAIKNALRSLDVEAIEHKAGNPRAKGSVENANNLVECLFESRLAYEPVEDIEQLNAASEAWYIAYNANTIPHYDSRLHRKHMDQPKARYAIWQIIRKEHLRILGAVELCRALLSGIEIARTVGKDLHISFKHPVSKQREHYDVAHIPGICIGIKLRVSPMINGSSEVLATFADYQGEDVNYLLPPIEVDRFSGFAAQAPTFGIEFKRRPDTVVEDVAKAAASRAFPGLNQEQIEKAQVRGDTPFGGLDAHSHLKHVSGPAFMARPGEMLSVPDRLHVEIKPLPHAKALMLLRPMLGRAVTIEENQRIAQLYPDGVPVEALQELAATLRAEVAAETQGVARLRMV